MSHYTTVVTKLKDEACICAALKEVYGWQALVHSQAVQLQGYQGDYRQETAEIVVPRHLISGASNDIGFKRNQDGTYSQIVSEFDRRFFNPKQEEFLMSYAAQVIYKQVSESNGRLVVKEDKYVSGQRRLVVESTPQAQSRR